MSDAALSLARSEHAAVGRIVVQTAPPEPDDAVPFDRPLAGDATLAVVGRLIVARRADAAALDTLPLPISAIDTVLALAALPSTLPTVLMVFPYLAVGGAERVALDVVRGLADRVRFVVVSLEPHEARLGTTADDFRALTPYVYTAADALHPLLNFSLFAHLIRRFAPQTLYIANGTAWIYDALPTLKATFPQLRVVDQVYDHHAGWIERYDAPLVAALDAGIGCNRRIRAAFIERGMRQDSAHLIHNGIDLANFDPTVYDDTARAALRQRFGLPPGRRVVAFIARVHQQKRPMDFVELARQFAADASVVFLLVGDGPLAATVRETRERLGLANLIVHEFHQPAREVFAVADLLVLPSEYEGMPMVILEALAMGVPVVATDVGNVREVLERTQGGQVVEKIGDVPGLRRAVQQVLAAPPEPAALRAAVAREFGLPEMVAQYERVLLGGG